MQITTNEKNAAFNPLFAKMQERFCVGGTIAEKMAIEAGLSKKRTRKASTARDNALPRTKAKRSFSKSFFNLKNLGALAMGLLLTSVLFLSGASFSGIREDLSGKSPANALSETQITVTESADTIDAI